MLRHARTFCVVLALGFVCTLAATAELRSGGKDAVEEEGVLAGLERQRKASLRARSIPGDWRWALDYEEQIAEKGGPLATMLQQLRAAKVPTREDAERVVRKEMYENDRGFATVAERTVGLVRCGVDLPGFAARGDLIWIVRVQEEIRPFQEAWVSSSTAEVRWMLPVTASLSRFVRSENAAAPSSETRRPVQGTKATADENPAIPSSGTLFAGPRSFRGHELLEDSSVRSTGIHGDLLYLFGENYRSGVRARSAQEGASFQSFPEENELIRRNLQTPEEAERLAARLRDQAASGSGSQAAGISVSGDPLRGGPVSEPGR